MTFKFHESRHRRFEPVIVFVHNFGGNHASTRRHQKMVLDMGFDCAAFDLSLNDPPNVHSLSLAFKNLAVARRKSVIHTWCDELESVLNRIERPKILYSLSFPSITVPALIAARPRRDILAWITDGGPFLDEWKCMWNLFTWGFPIRSLAVRALTTLYGYFWFGGTGYARHAKAWMQAWPAEVPILSIRAGEDKLVPASAIDKIFELNPNLNLQRLEIPQAAHLEGLKHSPEVYKGEVEKFLASAATKHDVTN